MKMRDIFKKVEAYNEIADMMRTDKAQIYFADVMGTWSHGEHCKTYREFTKYVKDEYQKEIADKILKLDGWEIDGELEIEWAGGIARYSPQLTTVY